RCWNCGQLQGGGAGRTEGCERQHLARLVGIRSARLVAVGLVVWGLVALLEYVQLVYSIVSHAEPHA
ncbi:MAG: hypothetical protein ABEN55_03045, partial [Bradymonadaceae bacterium]